MPLGRNTNFAVPHEFSFFANSQAYFPKMMISIRKLTAYRRYFYQYYYAANDLYQFYPF